jgi:hypothetical protein
MNKSLNLLGATAALLLCAIPAATIAQAPAPQGAPKRPTVATPEQAIRKDVFKGNESQIGAMHTVNADCTSGPVPDVRVVTQPTKGDVRFEQIRFPVDRPKDDARGPCNGKLVDAIGVFYKGLENGSDRLVLETDFRNGTVRRFAISIEVR